jgi:hypothetical protein
VKGDCASLSLPIWPRWEISIPRAERMAAGAPTYCLIPLGDFPADTEIFRAPRARLRYRGDRISSGEGYGANRGRSGRSCDRVSSSAWL